MKKNFRLYTKTFGGKIWTDLHRVSPGNFSAKKLNGIRLKISRQNTRNNNPCKKVFLNLLIFLHTIKIFNCLHEIMFLAHNTEKQHEKTKPYWWKLQTRNHYPKTIFQSWEPITFYVASDRKITIFGCQPLFVTQDK